MSRPELLEDEIGRKLREAEASGELQRAPGYGAPQVADSGWDDTPVALRMPFKILKDAGVVPPEVALMRERSGLRDELAAATDPAQRAHLQARLAQLDATIGLRLESLARER